jgi:hypothetical protein
LQSLASTPIYELDQYEEVFTAHFNGYFAQCGSCRTGLRFAGIGVEPGAMATAGYLIFANAGDYAAGVGTGRVEGTEGF